MSWKWVCANVSRLLSGSKGLSFSLILNWPSELMWKNSETNGRPITIVWKPASETFKFNLKEPHSTFYSLRRSITSRRQRSLRCSNKWKSMKMNWRTQTTRLNNCVSTLSTLSLVLQSTSLSRTILSTKSWPSILTTTQTGRSSKSCLCANLKASINLAQSASW